jgi:MFS family permease
MRNAGYGVGGVLAAVALSVGSGTAYQAVVLANAASYVVAFVLMLGVAGGRAAPADGDTAETERSRGWWAAFADRGYRTLIAMTFCYAMTMMTLNVSMPVYFVTTLGLPGWVPGTVFVINTVMIGLGQGLVVRRMTGHARRRVLQAAVAFTAAAFAMLYAADALDITPAVVLVLVAAAVYTLGELTGGPVVSALSAEMPPPEQRGRYMAAGQLAWSASAAISPLLYSALLDQGALAAWAGPVAVCVVWLALVEVLARRVPLVRRPVTNVAEPEPEPVGSTAEAPASS